MPENNCEHDGEDPPEGGQPPAFLHIIGTCPEPVNGLCPHPDPEFNCEDPPP